MTKLILMAALLLAVLTAACTTRTDEAYQAPPQQSQADIEQQNLFTEKGLSKTGQQPQQEQADTEQQEQQQPPQQQPPQVQNVPEETPRKEGAQDQFYYVSKLHWPQMPVTYFIENEEGCGRYEANRIRRAFRDISNATGKAVLFTQANDSGSADIEIRCAFIEDCYELSTDIRDGYVIRTETICQHQLGVTRTIAEGNRLVKAYIELIGLAGFAETRREGPSGFYVGTCGHTITEVHELLHAFGYGHSEDNSSIMNPEADVFGLTVQKEGACKGSEKAIDAGIVAELINTYSDKSGS